MAKLGLVTAAAATVLFVFIYKFQGNVFNRVMSEPPMEPVPSETIENTPMDAGEDVALPAQIPELTQTAQTGSEKAPDISEETQEGSEPAKVEEELVTEPAAAPQQNTTKGPTRRIYGKITLSSSGEQLGGVNIMVPGSTVAKISNPNGGYTIEVPQSARELVFIYRGKKLVHRIDPNNNLVNVALNLETMQYD